MAFSTAGSGSLRAEINITPMIDILLVLIIVFMVVVVSMPKEKGLEAQIPQPANRTQTQTPARTIVIQLNWTAENHAPTVMINEERVKWEDLHDRLFDIFKQRAERIGFVKAEDDMRFRLCAHPIAIA